MMNDRIPSSYEAIAIDGATTLTAAKLTPAAGQFAGHMAAKAFCTVDTDDIRYTLDGSTTPTSTVGHLAVSGSSFILEGGIELANFKAIKVTTAASLKVTYYHNAKD
jgi:hypothetical protein